MSTTEINGTPGSTQKALSDTLPQRKKDWNEHKVEAVFKGKVMLVATVVGSVAFGALVGVGVALAIAVTWPVSLPVIILVGVGVGLVFSGAVAAPMLLVHGDSIRHAFSQDSLHRFRKDKYKQVIDDEERGVVDAPVGDDKESERGVQISDDRRGKRVSSDDVISPGKKKGFFSSKRFFGGSNSSERSNSPASLPGSMDGTESFVAHSNSRSNSVESDDSLVEEDSRDYFSGPAGKSRMKPIEGALSNMDNDVAMVPRITLEIDGRLVCMNDGGKVLPASGTPEDIMANIRHDVSKKIGVSNLPLQQSFWNLCNQGASAPIGKYFEDESKSSNPIAAINRPIMLNRGIEELHTSFDKEIRISVNTDQKTVTVLMSKSLAPQAQSFLTGKLVDLINKEEGIDLLDEEKRLYPPFFGRATYNCVDRTYTVDEVGLEEWQAFESNIQKEEVIGQAGEKTSEYKRFKIINGFKQKRTTQWDIERGSLDLTLDGTKPTELSVETIEDYLIGKGVEEQYRLKIFDKLHQGGVADLFEEVGKEEWELINSKNPSVTEEQKNEARARLGHKGIGPVIQKLTTTTKKGITIKEDINFNFETYHKFDLDTQAGTLKLEALTRREKEAKMVTLRGNLRKSSLQNPEQYPDVAYRYTYFYKTGESQIEQMDPAQFSVSKAVNEEDAAQMEMIVVE